jgi:uncharacterized protein with GYD domain
VEVRHGVPDRGQHPLDLVLAAFVQRELDPPPGKPPRLRRGREPVIELYAVAEALERLIGRLALDLGHVDLFHLVAWVGQHVRELAVVGEQERTGRVRIEPADRDDAAWVSYEVDYGWPPMRVTGGRDHTGRLVQEDVGERLELDPATVDLDPVTRGDEGVQLPRLPVDGDAARLDQDVGAAPRGHPSAGEVGVQAHNRHYWGVPHYVTLMRWTSQGVAGLPAWRERVEEGERVIEEAGGKLIGVYVTLGRYDVVEIFEAPDDDNAAEILMKLQRHGAEHTETLRAFTRPEAEAIIRRL